MATKPWLFAGIAALLAAVGGGVVFFTNGHQATADEIFNATYYCDVTGARIVAFGGLSSTGYTAYPFAENRSSPESCLHPTSKIKGTWRKENITFGCQSNKWLVHVENGVSVTECRG